MRDERGVFSQIPSVASSPVTSGKIQIFHRRAPRRRTCVTETGLGATLPRTIIPALFSSLFLLHSHSNNSQSISSARFALLISLHCSFRSSICFGSRRPAGPSRRVLPENRAPPAFAHFARSPLSLPDGDSWGLLRPSPARAGRRLPNLRRHRSVAWRAACLALGTLFLSAAHPDEDHRLVRVQIEWRSSKAECWAGVLETSQGTIEHPASLGVAGDEAGTLWADGKCLWLGRHKASDRDGFEVSVIAPPSAHLSFTLQSARQQRPAATV